MGKMIPIHKNTVLFCLGSEGKYIYICAILLKCGPKAVKHCKDYDLAFWKCLKNFIISWICTIEICPIWTNRECKVECLKINVALLLRPSINKNKVNKISVS